jgi:hypothetical protein
LIANAEGLRNQDQYSGKKILKNIAECKADRNTSDAKRTD